MARLIDVDTVLFHIILDGGLSKDDKIRLVEDIKQIKTSSPSWYCQECEHYPREQVSCPCDVKGKRKEDTGCD